jgi:putative transposase
MARLSRAVIPGIPHHVTQRGVRSMRVFHREADFRHYLFLLSEQAKLHSLDVVCYCLMPNHVHLICVPGNEDCLSGAIGEAHRQYTLMINQRQGVKGHLFQERFFSCPLDIRHFRAAVPYILNNPVKAEMCGKAEDYPWSSARYNLGLLDSDPLATITEHMQDLSDLKLLLEHPDHEPVEKLIACTRTGRPCGSDSFVRALELISGKKLTPRKRGRPSKS